MCTHTHIYTHQSIYMSAQFTQQPEGRNERGSTVLYIKDK